MARLRKNIAPGERETVRRTDRLDVVDLHGNSNKQEVTPDGTPDKAQRLM